MARPTKLNARLQAQLVEVIAAGVSLDAAAPFVRLSRSTLRKWHERGKNARSGPFRVFFIEIERALAEAEIRDVIVIAKAARDGNWKAAAWRLERRSPERWGPRKASEAARATVEENYEALRKYAELARNAIPSAPEPAPPAEPLPDPDGED